MNRLWVKLSLAFLAIALAAIGLVALVAQRATGERFRQYVVDVGMAGQPAWAEALTDYYATKGSWEGVGELLAQLGTSGLGLGRGRAPRARQGQAWRWSALTDACLPAERASWWARCCRPMRWRKA